MWLRMLAVCLFAAILAAQSGPEYGGPSVLSRGMGASITARHANLDFRPRFGVSGVCDNGLTAVSVDAQGHLPNVVACGVEANAGISGFHIWKRTRLGIDYGGNYRHYPREHFYNGTDQLLGLGLTHQLARRVMFDLRTSAGTYARNYFGYTGVGFFEPSSLQTPGASLFDSPVYYGTTGASLTYLLSARWSANMGGSAYAARYRSDALYGANSYGAHGDVVYRYSRYGSVGGAYQFFHSEFTRSFGGFDYHVAGLVYSLRISRSWEFQLQAGAGRVESLTVQRTPVDPAIAAITGQSSAILAAYHLNYFPDVAAGLTKAWRRSTLTFRYARSISAGNGVYLTSQSEDANANFGYTGLRHWSVNAAGGYNKLKAVQQTIGVYEGYLVGGGMARTLSGGFQFVFRVDERHYTTGAVNVRRNIMRATMGIMWSPGDIPLTLW